MWHPNPMNLFNCEPFKSQAIPHKFGVYFRTAFKRKSMGFWFSYAGLTPIEWMQWGWSQILVLTYSNDFNIYILSFEFPRPSKIRLLGLRLMQRLYLPFTSMSSRITIDCRWRTMTSTHGRWSYEMWKWKTEANTCAK